MGSDDSQARPPHPALSIIAWVTTAGVPVAGEVLHPLLGEIVIITELVLTLTVIFMALFGSADTRERAFRLLRWFGNRPEPPAPGQSTRGTSDSAP